MKTKITSKITRESIEDYIERAKHTVKTQKEWTERAAIDLELARINKGDVETCEQVLVREQNGLKNDRKYLRDLKKLLEKY